MILDLEWGAVRNQFVVEAKSPLTPRLLELAIAQLRRIQERYPDRLPMVAAPYLSADAIRQLTRENISGVDLAGNYVIIVPGSWFVVNTGQPNSFPANQPIKEIYSGTSSLVGRVLLSRPEYPQAKDVTEEIARRGGRITKGTVSKVLSALEDDLIISRTPAIKLLQPEELLRKLALNYRRPKPEHRILGRVQSLQEFLQALKTAAKAEGIDVIGRDESLYVVSPTSDRTKKIYISKNSHSIDDIGLTKDDRFPNVEISIIRGQAPYFDPVEHDGFPWCSPLQIYLELVTGDAREQTLANEIGRSILARIESGH
jgi:hypothetical protein